MRYESRDDDDSDDADAEDEREARLGDVLPIVKPTMRWDYDFGDGWEHGVVVEAGAPARRVVRCSSTDSSG